jgi:hypothetical protein
LTVQPDLASSSLGGTANRYQKLADLENFSFFFSRACHYQYCSTSPAVRLLHLAVMKNSSIYMKGTARGSINL